MVSGTGSVIRHIEDLFGDIYAADEVDVWLHAPQEVLDGKRPIDLINSGRGDTVVKAIHAILDDILV